MNSELWFSKRKKLIKYVKYSIISSFEDMKVYNFSKIEARSRMIKDSGLDGNGIFQQKS